MKLGPKGQNRSFGFELVGAIAVFTALGYGLDRWLHAAPWFMLLGLIFGFGLGLWNLARVSSQDEPAEPNKGEKGK